MYKPTTEARQENKNKQTKPERKKTNSKTKLDRNKRINKQS